MRREAKLKTESDVQAKLLNGTVINIAQKVGKNDHLLGSVTTQNIVDQLEKAGFHIERRKIQLEEPIRTLGEHKVSIRLHRDVTVEISVLVLRAESGDLSAVSPLAPQDHLETEALRIFGDRQVAGEWLRQPIPSLGGRRPIDLIHGTTVEKERVSNILGRIEYGLF